MVIDRCIDLCCASINDWSRNLSSPKPIIVGRSSDGRRTIVERSSSDDRPMAVGRPSDGRRTAVGWSSDELEAVPFFPHGGF